MRTAKSGFLAAVQQRAGLPSFVRAQRNDGKRPDAAPQSLPASSTSSAPMTRVQLHTDCAAPPAQSLGPLATRFSRIPRCPLWPFSLTSVSCSSLATVVLRTNKKLIATPPQSKFAASDWKQRSGQILIATQNRFPENTKKPARRQRYRKEQSELQIPRRQQRSVGITVRGGFVLL
jgi:hypothetical protein